MSAACGKKGPPLAPLVPIPAAVELIEANRLGSDVFVSLTIPATNIDEHTPADVARVEVYGYTGRTAPPRARWVELATLVATVPIAPPPKPEDEPQSEDSPDQKRATDDPKRATGDPKRTTDGVLNAPIQGARVTVRDTLTPDELVQGKEAPVIRDPRSAVRDPRSAIADVPAAAGGAATGVPTDRAPRVVETPLKRFYIAVPFSARGRPGPPGGVAEFPLLPTPDPPPAVVARYTDRAIVLQWEPSGGLLGFLLERALPEEPLPFIEDEPAATTATEPLGPLGYMVYREILPDVAAPPAPSATPSWREEALTPLTPIPVATLTFTDSVEFGRRRCYTVRAVRGVDPAARIGDPSPPACLTPIDTFQPAPPRTLTAVASEGVISLIWEPNTELDLGGYIVLRGEAPGDTLEPLTAAPVVEAAYRDPTVKPGVRYVYAVMAVDNRFPLPNVSLESNRVEELAR